MDKMQKSDEAWKKELTDEQYRVMRGKGTENPFTGEYVHENAKGTYKCAACGAELFTSETKFDSGTGWPSFYDAKPGAVDFHEDTALGISRTEVACVACGAHLGHVFDDGPEITDDGAPATGKRFCINSVCLALDKKEK